MVIRTIVLNWVHAGSMGLKFNSIGFIRHTELESEDSRECAEHSYHTHVERDWDESAVLRR